ncbi:MAG: cytochrome c-type biogenesis protein CcmH [Actinomycetota bacterium]
MTAGRAEAARRRSIAWVGLAVAALALLVVAGVDGGGVETDAERVQRLSASFACPTCTGQSVGDSNAASAANIRRFISDSVTAGRSDREIRDDLIQAYDADVLLNPPAEGISTLVWVLPVVLVVVGALGVATAVTRNRGRNRDPSAEDRALVAEALGTSAGEDTGAGGAGP